MRDAKATISQQQQAMAPAAMPAALPGWVTPELIRRTLDVWQPKYGQRLTRDNAIEILLNFGTLVDSLVEAPL